jgi:chaperonin cofactor prefoldin
MSEDPTADIGEKYQTKPTIQTILEKLDEFRVSMEKRFDSMEKRFDTLDVRVDKIETQLDRVTSVAHETRADFKELRNALKEHFPSAVK